MKYGYVAAVEAPHCDQCCRMNYMCMEDWQPCTWWRRKKNEILLRDLVFSKWCWSRFVYSRVVDW